MDPLYRRLEVLETREIKQSLEDILPSERIDPTKYLKDERYYQKGRDGLSYVISSYLAGRGTIVEDNFAKKLYLSFTPKREFSKTGSLKPFLDILYGRILADKLPNEVFEELYDFEAMYFLAGLWSGNSARFIGDIFTKKNVHGRNVKTTIAWTIKQGIKKLKKYEITTGKTLPRKDKILKSCDEAMDTQVGLF